tara:strand:- start:119 stop:232 length:114 start_codon:yes stop_codon:yes gene_type:complete
MKELTKEQLNLVVDMILNQGLDKGIKLYKQLLTKQKH